MSRWWNAALIAIAAAVACDSPELVEFDFEVANVTVTPDNRVLTVGDTMRLTAYAKNADGQPLGSVRIDWETANDSIAGVRSIGHFSVVEAKRVGTTRIRALSEGKTGEVVVTVIERHLPVASIEITPAAPVLAINETVALEAVARAADGTVLGGRAVSWTSSAMSVATVTSVQNPALAHVLGLAEGETVITATSEGVQGTIRVRVHGNRVAVGHVLLRPSTLGAWVDQLVSYGGSARVLAANGLPLEGRLVTWSVADSTIARMTPSGGLLALRPGRTQVIATSEGVSGRANLVVFARPAGNTMQFELTHDWWDDDVHILPSVARVNYTDKRGVTKQVELYPERATLKMDRLFTGNRWEQEIVAVGYTDDGTGARHTIEQRIVDRGTYTFDMTSDRPLVFTSELSQRQAFTGRVREFEFHMQQAIGAAATQEYRYRLPE